jgi:hypothetical protein
MIEVVELQGVSRLIVMLRRLRGLGTSHVAHHMGRGTWDVRRRWPRAHQAHVAPITPMRRSSGGATTPTVAT